MAVVKASLSRCITNLFFQDYFKIGLASLIFLCCGTPSFSQSIDQYESTYWFRYYNQLKLNQKWTWHNEVEERRLINPDRQAQFFIHTHIHYQIQKTFDLAAGINFNETTRSNGLLIAEWRPWQEVSYIPELNTRIKLSFRYRLDERFIHRSSGSDLEHGYNFNLRHRFRVQASSALNKKESITLRFFDEVMINSGLNTDLFDQNRAYLGVDFMLSKKCSIEVGYINQLVLRSDQLTMFNVLRTTFWHRLNWKKSNS